MNCRKINLSFNNDTTNAGYPIFIGSGLLDNAALWQEILPHKQICIVSNAAIAEHYLEKVTRNLADKEVITVLLEDGETYKTIASWSSILDALVTARYHRDCAIIALGGGIVGDIAGFAGASYQRGVACIQVPTTLLAQVDSSVGGKTGVNHQSGKNLIGAFHQPQAVLIDIDTLSSLPKREFAAGMAEVVKYGLINDPVFFDWLENNQTLICDQEQQTLIEMIAHCCTNKAAIVQADERESSKRALLNLGHTFGHALEAITHYKRWKHGECVALGIMCALRLSQQLGRINEKQYLRAQKLFQAFDLPVFLPDELSAQEIYSAMQLDKKVKDGKMRLVLQRNFCHSQIESDNDKNDILFAIKNSRNKNQ